MGRRELTPGGHDLTALGLRGDGRVGRPVQSSPGLPHSVERALSSVTAVSPQLGGSGGQRAADILYLPRIEGHPQACNVTSNPDSLQKKNEECEKGSESKKAKEKVQSIGSSFRLDPLENQL
ncbi:hypothetical protein D623_10025393 [Myotis brandtii]|uniref:Uncharacterized protein n=1 Tax=Myotis brandtii TaxID=109478 RepID=S7NDG2_MYOBR|nr:hypothetical protein D623_10025393 [Myotis brandtii]